MDLAEDGDVEEPTYYNDELEELGHDQVVILSPARVIVSKLG